MSLESAINLRKDTNIMTGSRFIVTHQGETTLWTPKISYGYHMQLGMFYQMLLTELDDLNYSRLPLVNMANCKSRNIEKITFKVWQHYLSNKQLVFLNLIFRHLYTLFCNKLKPQSDQIP